MTDMTCLPPEILLQIFKFYLKTESQINFMNCVSKVCRIWQDLCLDPSLWEEFDGTLPFKVLKEFCNKGILKNCKVLTFSGIAFFPSAIEMKDIFGNLPHLNCLKFSYLSNLGSKHFYDELAVSCPELKEIVINDELHCGDSLELMGFRIPEYSLFKDFLRLRGKDLVSLVVKNLYLPSTTELFWTVGYSCPNLEILAAENIEYDNVLTFPTVHMQKHCSKLRILCLGYPVIISNEQRIVGFRNLEIFKNRSQLNYLFPRCAIDSIIFESPKLKELDISRCVFVKRNCLHPPNYSHLEKLNISYGIVYDFTCFIEVIQKWSHSLKVLDVSNITDVSLNDVFQTVIVNCGLLNLIALNLNTTSVTIQTVKLILQNCPKLCVLDLEFCSDLEELSSKYESESAIKELLWKLSFYY